MTTPADRLAALGLELPPAPGPAASYVPAKRAGDLLLLAGQVPLVEGALRVTGRLGEDVDVPTGQAEARRCALNALAVLHGAVGLDAVAELVRVVVLVAAAPGFTQAHVVADGASDMFVAVLGDAGRHVRTALGVAALPLGAVVEVEVTARVA